MAAAPSVVFAPYIRDADFAVRQPWVVPERRLLDYLLVYIQQGQCLFRVDGTEHHLTAGDFCLVQPGQLVYLEGLTRTVTPYAHFDLAFNARRHESFATRPGQLNLAAYKDLLQPRLSLFGGTVPTQFRPANPATYTEKWLGLIRLWNLGSRLEQLEAENLLGALMLQLMRDFQSGPHVPSHGAALSWIPSYLSTRLADEITISEMAERARLSPSRFQVVFRQIYGTTPGRYLLEMRVGHAAELLETTDWILAHIADLCGFADVHHFAKAFKRLTGKTPGQHRQEKMRALNP